MKGQGEALTGLGNLVKTVLRREQGMLNNPDNIYCIGTIRQCQRQVSKHQMEVGGSPMAGHGRDRPGEGIGGREIPPVRGQSRGGLCSLGT